MPTTVSGLLLFVVLLLPGFAYQIGKKRRGSERTTSVLRETAAVVTSASPARASSSSHFLAVVMAHRLGRLVRDPRNY